MARRLYAVHRWVAAIAFVQFAVWTLSGFVFAALSEERVSGSPVAHAHEAPLIAEAAMSPADAAECFAGMGMPELHRMELRATPAGLFYLGRSRDGALRLHARTCKAALVTREEAEATARRDQPGEPPVRSVEYIETAPIEYRTRPVPAWRVSLGDGAETNVYVDARTGDVTARRNGAWRTFDFFYGLHIMQYETRSDRHHPLLIAAASLAMLTVWSGLVLWAIRLARWIKSRAAARQTEPNPAAKR
jgi:hypothetical protein